MPIHRHTVARAPDLIDPLDHVTINGVYLVCTHRRVPVILIARSTTSGSVILSERHGLRGMLGVALVNVPSPSNNPQSQ
ncbi:hypothetical protein HC891_09070 [Candidatus Gracilibacteria bacterium]|nr:hypothetical protein [Candidatus Gracilibacteria bacterium]